MYVRIVYKYNIFLCISHIYVIFKFITTACLISYSHILSIFQYFFNYNYNNNNVSSINDKILFVYVLYVFCSCMFYVFNYIYIYVFVCI